MFDSSADLPAWRGGWLNRLVAHTGFQSWAAKFPLTRGKTRADGAEIFDLVQGFVKSQALMALVELRIFEHLRGGSQSSEQLGLACGIAPERMQILLQSGAAMNLLRRRRDGRFALARKGAAIMGVPGLQTMIQHHRAFYRDLEDPVALLREPESTELSHFWPYVFGAKSGIASDQARVYSNLMTESQALVAQDTLQQVSFKHSKHVMDIGGGTGAFLSAVAQAYPNLDMTLFDLDAVVADAPARLSASGLAERVSIRPGSFRDDPLPEGADTICLIRVLYDHADETVEALLAKVFDALPPGGRLIVSEPMGGGSRPDATGDVYFAFYTMAMQTGKARSSAEIAEKCEAAGFVSVRSQKPSRPFVTRVLTAVKPD